MRWPNPLWSWCATRQHSAATAAPAAETRLAPCWPAPACRPQLAQGYIMLCVAYPTGDCIIETNRESELM